MKRLFRISPCPVCGKPVSPLSRFYVRNSWICRECADLAGCLFGGNSVSTADRLALMRTEEIAGLIRKEKAEHAAIVRAFSADWTNHILFHVASTREEAALGIPLRKINDLLFGSEIYF